MIAVDTNVIVRLIANDNAKQAKTSADLIKNNRIFVPKTVLLECEWVLRHTYELDRDRIVEAFKRLASISQVQIEDDSRVIEAIELFENGMDFADALHLTSSPPAEQFATFDKKLVNQAKKYIESPDVLRLK
ncbi:MAG: type II toxin-antitoxin system VapC family toxin [Candidatus Omnitrophica bacterium]|nr:type II toxin-antitoxin system VapC family toxin [Candidatus Omnitrophota bacterium]